MRAFGAHALILAVFSAILLSPALSAAEVGAVKGAADKCGNWLVDQYDFKAQTFKGKQDPQTLAMIVTALCTSARDYKESNGPYISDPVKLLVHTASNSDKPHSQELLGWIRAALESTQNHKFAELIKALPELQLPAADNVAAAAEKTSLLNTLGVLSKKMEKDELKSKAAPIAEALLKFQQKNGSFGDDLQVNALALRVLTICHKAIK